MLYLLCWQAWCWPDFYRCEMITVRFTHTRDTKRFTVYTEIDERTGKVYPDQDMKRGMTDHQMGTVYLRTDGKMPEEIEVTVNGIE